MRIAGPAGEALPEGEIGELWLRGQSLVRGYWRDEAATAGGVHTDGWFRTGDLATVRDGRVSIVDRLKDMVIRGGENVYCVEVEAVLHDHPDVADAAVLGVPHPVLGEEVAAVVRLRAGATVTADELRAHVGADASPPSRCRPMSSYGTSRCPAIPPGRSSSGSCAAPVERAGVAGAGAVRSGTRDAHPVVAVRLSPEHRDADAVLRSVNVWPGRNGASESSACTLGRRVQPPLSLVLSDDRDRALAGVHVGRRPCRSARPARTPPRRCPPRVRTSTAYPASALERDEGQLARRPRPASGARTCSVVPGADAQPTWSASSQPSFHLCQPSRSLLAPQSSDMMSQWPTAPPPSLV